MKNLLRIDSSTRKEGSHSREMADYFEEMWNQQGTGRETVKREIGRANIPHLSNDLITAWHASKSNQTTALSDALIGEVKWADHLLISLPLHNFSITSGLKSWIDHVLKHGETFRFLEDGTSEGLVKGKSATIICASGAPISADNEEFVSCYLKKVLSFIGIDNINVFFLCGTTTDATLCKQNKETVIKQIDWALSKHSVAKWDNEFTWEEKIAISNTRDMQESTILAGDALAYADICIPDITLFVPGFQTIKGREQFITAEQSLFSKAKFKRFKKQPQSISKHGNIAIEIGIQHVESTMEKGNGVYASEQKYMHIYENYNGQWLYHTLSSSPTQL